MGARSSKVEQDLLAHYEAQTFLTKEEITSAYTIFSSFFPDGQIPSIANSRVSMQEMMERLPFLKYNPFRDRISAVFSTYPAQLQSHDDATTSFSGEQTNQVNEGPQIHISPSNRELATSGGSWCFEDFLHFLSAFNEKAPAGLKHEVVFCIYDSDGDGFIGEQDLLNVVKRIVGQYSLDSSIHVNQTGESNLANPYDVNKAESLKEEEYNQIVEQVFHESDLDRDRKMGLKEFTNTIIKFPDFAKHFCVPPISNFV